MFKNHEFCDMAKLHIGSKIKEVLDNSPMKAVELASKINLTRNGLYKIFEKESIAADQLQKISVALNHDFFVYYQNHLNILKEGEPQYGFATKEDLATLTKLVKSLAADMNKIQVDLAKLAKNKPKKKTK